MKIACIDDVDGLQAQAAAWDDLWRRSDITSPAPQAEIVALWKKCLAASANFRAVTVSESGQMVAGLPLLGRRMGRVVGIGGMLTDAWCGCGDLLIDSNVDLDATTLRLAEGIQRLPWPLLWLDDVRIDTPRWKALERSLREIGMEVYVDPRYEIGCVDIDGDWDAYCAVMSRNHRRNMKRKMRRLAETGGVELNICSPNDPLEVESLLRRGFEVEDRSWKCASGTSVLQTPGIFDFYVSLSRLLADRGQLEIVFLEHESQPIAFELGWKAKGVYRSFKVGYDEAYAAASPGQLLRCILLENFHADPARHRLDFAGVLTEATAKWCNRTYRVGRMIIAHRGLTARLVMSLYKNAWPHLRRFRRLAMTSS